jgi:hypothetical protein
MRARIAGRPGRPQQMEDARMKTTLSLAAALLAAAPLAQAAGHVLANARLSVTFADTSAWAFADADRVDAITWIDSQGNARSNYVANGGPSHCGDPQEFFGESYGEPEGTAPLMIFAGVADAWKGTGSIKGTASTSLAGACDTAPDAKAKTTYKLSTGAGDISELEVTRAFLFDATTPVFNAHGLRAYVARVPLGAYPSVLVPNAAGTAVNTFSAGGCGGDCEVTDWNGRWFADDDGAGNGLMVIRSLSSTAPAILAINNDGYSASNLTSVVLLQPAGGWKAKVMETEYLCFYDAKSWSAAARAAGKMPKGCAGTKP